MSVIFKYRDKFILNSQKCFIYGRMGDLSVKMRSSCFRALKECYKSGKVEYFL